MCGIAGICNDGNKAIEDISAMNRAMHHRGPDDGSYWCDREADVTLGHRRLSIVDLSENGRQPMVSESGRWVMVYNGEIYNFKEIEKKLREEGCSLHLKGGSDTEVLLYALEYWGTKRTLAECKGMFAFALYDRKERELILARDRMGEKPLYYGFSQGRFIFASDLGCMKAVQGFHGQVNPQALSPYLIHGYIPAPLTIYQDVYKLRPGHYLTIRAPFREVSQVCYWDIRQVAKKGQQHPFRGSFEEAKQELDRLLTASVRGQMIADVPLGAFLSGGIDSTLTVSLMAKTGSRKVKTYTIGFEEEGYNEADYAAQTAAYLGTEHTQMMVGFSDVMEVLEQIPRAFTEPFADSSELPTMLVSKMTRQHVTVALSGDGGDEFFCGYNTYKDAAAGLQILRSKLPLLKGRLRIRTGALCEGLAGKGRSGLSGKYTAAMKKVGRVLSVDTPEELYRRIANADYRTDWLLGRQEKVPTAMSTYPDGYLEGAEPNLMLMDMLQYLPEDILVKVDRSGMFYSLESRIPILDRDVMEFAWSLPQEYKYADGVTKRILKEVLYRYVPREMMERPKKGFSVPLEKWLREGPMHTWARELMSDAASRAEAYIDTGLFEDMFARFEKTGEYGAVLWHVLMLEQWLVNNP